MNVKKVTLDAQAEHQVSGILDSIRTTIATKAPEECEATIIALLKSKNLTKIVVTQRTWQNEVKFYIAFSFDGSIVEHGIVSKIIKKPVPVPVPA
jgi:ABC-type phosphate transport system ATPase subunit